MTLRHYGRALAAASGAVLLEPVNFSVYGG